MRLNLVRGLSYCSCQKSAKLQAMSKKTRQIGRTGAETRNFARIWANPLSRGDTRDSITFGKRSELVIIWSTPYTPNAWQRMSHSYSWVWYIQKLKKLNAKLFYRLQCGAWLIHARRARRLNDRLSIAWMIFSRPTTWILRASVISISIKARTFVILRYQAMRLNVRLTNLVGHIKPLGGIRSVVPQKTWHPYWFGNSTTNLSAVPYRSTLLIVPLRDITTESPFWRLRNG